MYQYIQGQIKQIQPTYLVLEANGIGYQIWCANPFRWQEKMQEEIKIFIELVVREDAMLLYGFRDEAEKNLFLQLNKVSGIGPKSALSILALDDQAGLIQAIDSADAKYLMKFPGVGKKTAQQMILDLQGQLDLSQIKETSPVHTITNDHLEEVKQALEGLGYSKREIERVTPQIEKEQITSTQAGLSLAFKLLIK
ncbi:Holliday junction branch migration protein RuvA [Facklamia miroungae]|uniref:Holliday junction branch migration complex subunit RuvA n=1 Tax=Facklamia miroungae TaxID=120956 RepID=A0A1G7PNB8_9LACT|nr:Holliday junction branch migration protein RuvA [Facklamia miroungae]NKZ28770.1 Holliday junction branch migration protein RuvA [Facklamia miroungae]SDF87686.1 holliday junction DNA helicase RuvA [Facklamia miroungae]